MLRNYINYLSSRIKVFVVALTAFTLLISSSPVLSQDWLTAYNNSVELYNDGNAAKALDEAMRSEQLYQKQYDINHNNYRAILRQLSVVSYDLQNLNEGIVYANKEVSSWRKAVNVNEASYIDALDILGVLYSANEQYDSAVYILQEASNLVSVTIDYDLTEKAIKQGHLASALYGSGDLEQSYEQFKKVIEVLEQSEELPAEYLSFCYTYGKACVALKDYHAGIKYLKIMLDYYPPEYDNNPEVVDALIEMGKAETELAEYSAGAVHYSLALSRLSDKQSTEYINTTKLLADNLARQGKHEESKALLDEIGSSLEAGSNQAAFLLANQATVLLNSGDANGASHLFDSALFILKNNQPIDKEALGNISYNTATAYRTLGNKEKALVLYQEAIASSVETSVVYQKSIIGSARLLLSIGQKEAASASISKLNLSKKEDWRGTERGSIFNELGGYYQSVGDYELAAINYKDALTAVPAKTNTQLYNNIAFNYMSLLQASGKFAEAEQLLAAIEHELKSSNPALQLRFLQNTGSLYHAKGNLAEAEKQYTKALIIAASTYGEQSNEYADILLRQATLAKDKGAYDISEPLFKRALAVVDDKSMAAAAIHNNLGILFQQMGRLDEAQNQFNAALQIYKSNRGANLIDYVLTEENLATLYSLKGEQTKALELLSETVELNKEIFGSKSPNYAISLHNYASLLQNENKLEEAKPLFIEALDIQKNTFGINHPSYANTLHNLAVLAGDEKDYTLADSLLNQVIDIRAQLFDENHPSYTAALFSRAVLRQQMNNFELAKADFDKVCNLYLNQIIKYFPNLSEREKTAFYKKITPVFNRYKEFLLEYYINFKKDDTVLGQLYNIQIATKAILLNSVNKTRERILSSKNTELIADFTEWQLLKEQLAVYYTYSKAKLVGEGISISDFEEEVNRKEKKLSLASEAFANEFDKKRVVWQDVQAKLNKDQIGIELIRIERNSNDNIDSVTYIALAISTSFLSPTLIVYPNGKLLEDKYLHGYNNSIAYKTEDDFSYNSFWQPLEPVTKQFKIILLSADGVFNKVNANSLYNVASSTYLNQLQNVQYVSSTRDLLGEARQSVKNKNALLIADPYYHNSEKLASIQPQRSYNFGTISQLPATKIEVDDIAKIMKENGWGVSVFLGEEAQKQIMIQKSPELLHIAAHGFFLQANKGNSNFLDNPLFRSGLLLAGAGDDNIEIDNAGILTAYEVMNMNLDQTELVVLSACETALGDVQNGEGVYGLQRAFIVAGAHTLLMSLWKVDDDATQKLMSLFYKFWMSGVNKHEALQKAQLEIQKEYKYPYYWGAFIMIGI